MTPAKRRALRAEIDSLRRRGGVKPDELVSLAERLDRKPADRGKHLTYVSHLPGTNPVTIPYHGGKDVSPRAKKNILNELENDLDVTEPADPAEQGNGKD